MSLQLLALKIFVTGHAMPPSPRQTWGPVMPDAGLVARSSCGGAPGVASRRT